MPKEITFSDLQAKAKAMNITGYYAMNKKQLIVATAENREDSDIFVYDRAEGVPEKEIEQLRRDEKQIPGKTIMWKKDQDIVMEIVNRQPYAFNNTNLTDETEQFVHHFNTKAVKCVCGEKFKIQGEEKGTKINAMGKTEETIITHKSDRRYCPTCGRLHFYHGTDNMPSDMPF